METRSGLRTECVSDTAAFRRLRNEWNALVVSLDQASPFLSHEWFDAAWAWRDDGNTELRVLLVYHGEALVGICPLIRSLATYRFMRFHRLELLAVPDTQFCTIIVGEAFRAQVMEAIGTWLCAKASEWSVLELGYLREADAGAHGLAGALERRGLKIYAQSQGENPYVDLSSTWEHFYRGRSRRLKKGNNLVANRLERTGRIRLEWVHGNVLDEESLGRHLDTITRLSSSSWKRDTGFSLADEGPGKFISTLTRLANGNGTLSLFLLYLDDAPVAMEYQLIQGGTVYALRSDYDEDFAELSPGTYLNWKILETLFGNGLRAYFMGPGDNPYKRRWTESAVPLIRIKTFSRTPGGRASAFLFSFIIPALRNVRMSFGRKVEATS